MVKKSHAAPAAPKTVPNYSVSVRIGGDTHVIAVAAVSGDEAAAKALVVADDHRATVCGVQPYSA
jgi:hypothetical protein